jgi:hypothetical protein
MRSSLKVNRAGKLLLTRLLNDPELAVDLTITRTTAIDWDAENNENVETTSSLTVKAVKLKHTYQSVLKSLTPGVQEGEQVFLVQFADLPNGLTVNDIVEFESKALNIRPLNPILDIAWAITVKR